MRYVFNDCVFDTALRELHRGGAVVHVEPQVFDLIVLLLGNHDRIISMDELVDTVWEGRHVSESTIRNRINAARKAVGKLVVTV
jgi:DNA-binding winged helix-turn-helix (wHTH) protein